MVSNEINKKEELKDLVDLLINEKIRHVSIDTKNNLIKIDCEEDFNNLYFAITGQKYDKKMPRGLAEMGIKYFDYESYWRIIYF